MSFALDPAVLESITQEARQCFLEEDAPGYLSVLQQGLAQLAERQAPDYQALMRAAHSVKGGAGVAQMPALSKLAHKLEDLLEAWNKERIEERELAVGLLQQGLEELAYMLGAAQDSQEIVEADPNLLKALDEFNASIDAARHPHDPPPPPKALSESRVKLIETALESDLENCLRAIEDLLEQHVDTQRIREGLVGLIDEGLLLGEAYSLPWLVSTVEKIADLVERPPANLAFDDLARQSVSELRQARDRFLQELPDPDAETPTPELDTETPEAIATPDDRHAPIQLRIPLERLDAMGSAIGELITSHERLTIQQQQLKQASGNLRRLVEQVKPVRDRVQSFYDQMSTVGGSSVAANGSDGTEFDALEMDRYTALHSSLQTFEELITQVQETRVDIDLVSRELGQDLGQVRMDLSRLYSDVTISRLVPFKTFAQRFLPQLRRNAQRCGKKAELKVSGENVLVDKVLLEQLQTPLTHVLNNALDHGIEKPAERAILDKSETAQIFLGAKTEGSEVVITFADDGRGIDIEQIYQIATDRGLCPPSIPMNQLPRERILDFIFQPGFSTATTVSDISGRGVGMDIVRTQVQQLRGTIDVETLPGRGTTFTIRLPLSMSLLSLLLCQASGRILAIPADTVLDVIPYDDVSSIGPHQWPIDGRSSLEETDDSSISWRGQVLSLLPLMSMLPYERLPAMSSTSKVVLVLKGASAPLAVTVEAIVDERQLILKSFDDTIPIPPYIAGCTILGTGEAVPVILPRFLKPIKGRPVITTPMPMSVQGSRMILVAEDATGARRSLERILTHAGFSVIPCRNGQEALTKLEQRQGLVDLVISDVEMPVLNGFDLLGRIRTHSAWYTIPVVMLTSRTGDRHRQKAMSLGANAYLGKPVTPTELLSGIESLLPSS
ncbi:MAG: response regulator [Cyanobacteriota bacterium]|nr:response regulator [Cyanobacteriota bacterium]